MNDLEHPPAFQVYPSDFASDGIVEAMTTEEVGAYWLLLCKAWFEKPVGSIPDDDLILSRWSRLPMKRWLVVKKMVLKAFKPADDGRLLQKRMASTYQAMLDDREKKKQAGIKGANKRWHSHDDAIPPPSSCHDGANANAMTKDSSPAPTPSPNNRPEAGGRENDWTRPSVGALKSVRLLMEWLDAEAPKAGNPALTESFRVSVIAAGLRAVDQGDEAPKLFASLFMELLDGKITKLNQYRKKAYARYREWKPAE